MSMMPHCPYNGVPRPMHAQVELGLEGVDFGWVRCYSAVFSIVWRGSALFVISSSSTSSKQRPTCSNYIVFKVIFIFKQD